MRWLVIALLLAGCKTQDAPEECVEAPVLTWQTFGQDFTRTHCQPCHASSSPDRHGAPPSVTFDTEEDVWERADRILAVATGDNPIMPPLGGVDPEDVEALRLWITCY